MMTAKLFENGRSQAGRLPKECRFSGDEVSVSKVGEDVYKRQVRHAAGGGILPCVRRKCGLNAAFEGAVR